MSPIKAQTLFMQQLDQINERHAQHVKALMDGQAEYKKAAELIELLHSYGATTDLDLHASYTQHSGLDLVAYAHHCRSAERAVYDAIVATGDRFQIIGSHSDELRDVVFDGCDLRIVFRAEVVCDLQEAA